MKVVHLFFEKKKMKKNKVNFYFQKAGSKAMVNGQGKGKKGMVINMLLS